MVTRRAAMHSKANICFEASSAVSIHTGVQGRALLAKHTAGLPEAVQQSHHALPTSHAAIPMQLGAQ